jgi:hypothetical protein
VRVKRDGGPGFTNLSRGPWLALAGLACMLYTSKDVVKMEDVQRTFRDGVAAPLRFLAESQIIDYNLEYLIEYNL